MTRHYRLRNSRKGVSEDGSRGYARTKRSCGSAGHKAQEHSTKSAAVLEKVPQHADHSTKASKTHSTTESMSFHGSLDKGYERSKVHSYLQSCDAMHLLDNIPGAEHVHFVDQSLLSHARPKKLLVGYHSRSGDRIYAYVVPLNTLHRVELYTEHAYGQLRFNMNREGFARHRILHPFNKIYPRGAHNTTQADKARLELVIKWYFVAFRVVQTCFPGEAEAFSIRFCNALRYIANQSDHAADQLLDGSSAQQPRRIQASRKRRASSVHASESDIQSYLLQQFSPMSRTPSTAVLSVRHSPETRQVVTMKKTRNLAFDPPEERSGISDKV
jgi:hypothetical protein